MSTEKTLFVGKRCNEEQVVGVDVLVPFINRERFLIGGLVLLTTIEHWLNKFHNYFCTRTESLFPIFIIQAKQSLLQVESSNHVVTKQVDIRTAFG